eukprot:1317320-Rhodomonas_salina.1
MALPQDNLRIRWHREGVLQPDALAGLGARSTTYLGRCVRLSAHVHWCTCAMYMHIMSSYLHVGVCTVVWHAFLSLCVLTV